MNEAHPLVPRLASSSASAGIAQLILRWLSLAAGLYYIAVFLGLALIRLFYPYELEWSEGAILDQVYWIVQGAFAYGPPSLHFIPITYNPLYLYLSALIARFVGLSFLAPRLVSILATLGSLYLIYRLVYDHTRSKSAGWAAAGVYAATFRFSGAWLDLAKVDSLFLFLVLAAHWTGRRQTRQAWITSGLLYVMAYYTKQLALPLILSMALASLVQFKGRTWPQWLTAGAAGALVFIWLEASSGGWYSFYTMGSLSYQERLPVIWAFWQQFLSAAWPGLLAAFLAGLAVLRWKRQEVKPVFWQDIFFAGALIVISWSVFFKVWTYDNGFIPACAGLALLTGWGLGWAWADQPAFPRPGWLNTAASILLLTQFALLFYSPLKQLPSPEAAGAAARLTQLVKELPGDVLVLQHAFVAVQAGKTPYFHSVTYTDPTAWAFPPRSAADAQKRALVQEVWASAQKNQSVPWIIVDSHPEYWYPDYVVVTDLTDQFQALEPVTGVANKPRFLLAPNPLVHGGEVPLVDPTYQALFQEEWQLVEEDRRYLHGQQGVLNVLLAGGYDYWIELSLQAPCLAGQPRPRWITVLWNEEQLGDIIIPPCGSATAGFAVPASSVLPQGNRLTFGHPPEAENPAENTTVGFTSIRFIQQP